MKAGRDLDILIAERVMGAKVLLEFLQNAASGATYEVPRYSADIASAWKVLEKMNSKGFEDQNLSFTDDWHVFISDYTDEGAGKAEEKTAPHAICLAALRALGEKI